MQLTTGRLMAPLSFPDSTFAGNCFPPRPYSTLPPNPALPTAPNTAHASSQSLAQAALPTPDQATAPGPNQAKTPNTDQATSPNSHQASSLSLAQATAPDPSQAIAPQPADASSLSPDLTDALKPAQAHSKATASAISCVSPPAPARRLRLYKLSATALNADNDLSFRIEAMTTFLSDLIADLLQFICDSLSYLHHASPELPCGTLSGSRQTG